MLIETNIKNKPVRRVAVMPSKKDTELEVTKAVIRLCAGHGCEVFAQSEYSEALAGLPVVCTELEGVISTIDACVAVGGDGKFLSAAQLAATHSVPLVGLNLGRVGFLAEIEADELETLTLLFDGVYNIENRIMLSVSINRNDGSTEELGLSLNDAVLTCGPQKRIVELEISEGSEFITSIRGDGLVIATPTGSTAYSLSAGGSVVDPRLSCLCVTPVCVHSLVSKPLIFSPAATIIAKNRTVRDEYIYLCCDGRDNIPLFCGESVTVRIAQTVTRLIKLSGHGFYHTLRNKLRE